MSLTAVHRQTQAYFSFLHIESSKYACNYGLNQGYKSCDERTEDNFTGDSYRNNSDMLTCVKWARGNNTDLNVFSAKLILDSTEYISRDNKNQTISEIVRL